MSGGATHAALVTGASGFLGRRLVGELARRGRRVVALVRSPPASDELRGPRVERVRGDLFALRPADVPRGATLFHLAAARVQPRVDRDEMLRVNRDGALHVARVARDGGASRLVYVSTALVFGPSGGAPADEGSDFTAWGRSHPYVASRILALEALGEEMRGDLEVATVFPTLVYGPDHPSHPNAMAAQMRRLARGRLGWRVAGWSARRDLVHVDDVVAGMLGAEERAPAGSGLILGGEDLSPEQFRRRVLAALARRMPLLPLPAALVRAAARIADRLLLPRRALGYAARLRMLEQEWRFSSARAAALIGYRPRTFDRGLRQTLAELGLAP